MFAFRDSSFIPRNRRNKSDKTNRDGVNNYIRNKSSCDAGSFKPDNLEIVWIITN